jgi:hypothetical protein
MTLPMAFSPNASRTRCLTILRLVVIEMDSTLSLAQSSWRAKRGGEVSGRPEAPSKVWDDAFSSGHHTSIEDFLKLLLFIVVTFVLTLIIEGIVLYLFGKKCIPSNIYCC